MDKQLTVRQIILIVISAVLIGAPAIFMVETRIGLGRWVLDLQDKLIGSHLMVSSIVIVMLIEILCIGIALWIIAIAIRFITGRTLVEMTKMK